ncbi:MAG: aminotransferase class I and II [Chloroflexi bacterium]|nr:aminotransferase class I and II [Chloroflexota bacterium]
MPPESRVPPLRTVRALRYVTPLREGGSLPAIMEADDDGLYVVKFHGAGQGPKALVAELIAAGIGRALGLPVPEPVLVELDPALGMAEPDPEIQDLLERSAGLNVGLDYLPGSLPIGSPLGSGVSPELAADVVWFDAFLTNVDRTPRNPNLLLWHRQLWLIDHGAALYTQHGWSDDLDAIAAGAGARFAVVRDHVLLPIAGPIRDADGRLASRLSQDLVREVVETIPDELLENVSPFPTPERHREAYATHLLQRLSTPRGWVDEAEEARRAGG